MYSLDPDSLDVDPDSLDVDPDSLDVDPDNYRLRYGRMVKALACRVEGPGFQSHHGKSFG